MDELMELISRMKWEEAKEKATALLAQGENSDTFWILNGTIYEAAGDLFTCYSCIMHGLAVNPDNYELYFMLGNYYRESNQKQAMISYRYALQLCTDETDRSVINEQITSLDCAIPATTVITYRRSDTIEQMNRKIKQTPVDDNILLVQEHVIYNQQILFWLELGLYDNENCACVSPLSNSIENNQYLHLETKDPASYLAYNLHEFDPLTHLPEEKVWLSSAIQLIRRTALDVTGLPDQKLACIQDALIDLGLRFARQKFSQRVLHNVCVYQTDCTSNPFSTSQELREKWGCSIHYYANVRMDLICYIREEKDAPIHVLEVGCGCGSTLSHIRHLFPNARTYGIELMEFPASLGTHMGEIHCMNVETVDQFPFPLASLDYVIFGDLLEHLREPDTLIKKLYPYLRPHGRILSSIPNLMNASVITKLLQGDFTYKDAGLLDQTHIHFFTYNEIVRMFTSCGYDLVKYDGKIGYEDYSEKDQKLMEQILTLSGIADHQLFQIYQFLVVAQKPV